MAYVDLTSPEKTQLQAVNTLPDLCKLDSGLICEFDVYGPRGHAAFHAPNYTYLGKGKFHRIDGVEFEGTKSFHFFREGCK